MRIAILTRGWSHEPRAQALNLRRSAALLAGSRDRVRCVADIAAHQLPRERRGWRWLPARNTAALADEYRRLSDMAITAQEHVDLRLTDLSVRVDELRDQLEQMQRILKEVE